jgi:hypothetical protein
MEKKVPISLLLLCKGEYSNHVSYEEKIFFQYLLKSLPHPQSKISQIYNRKTQFSEIFTI